PLLPIGHGGPHHRRRRDDHLGRRLRASARHRFLTGAPRTPVKGNTSNGTKRTALSSPFGRRGAPRFDRVSLILSQGVSVVVVPRDGAALLSRREAISRGHLVRAVRAGT